MCAKWAEIANFVEQHHPDKVVANRAVNIFNDNVMSTFRKILQRRKKQQTIDKFFRKEIRQATAEQDSDSPQQKIQRTETPEEQLPSIPSLGTVQSIIQHPVAVYLAASFTIVQVQGVKMGQTFVQMKPSRRKKTGAQVILKTPPATSGVPSNPSAGDESGRHFDAASFIGGIVLCLGLGVIAFIGLKYYRSRSQQNYRTL
ncbi:hypothetical protein C0Q70_10887 [Pomacea canaliculata]|uniref:Uncharacterized protein n=1 Tax=Pomacea canaliculata TaxID=400727 RepID=A0A2T7P4G5_POMCA|nr:hypothetical protein C0Q70_10887 [Pomacea canaliculata]